MEQVKEKAQKLFPKKNLVVEMAGAYRRGMTHSDKVDILITPSGDLKKTGACFFGSNKTIELSEIAGILQKLVKELEYDKFLMTEKFLSADKIDKSGSQKYSGICQLEDGTKHIIDIKVYPRSQFSYGLIYYTGPENFNKEMRIKALNYGYTLLDNGLTALPSQSKAKIVGKQMSVEVQTSLTQLAKANDQTEESIFKAFGMQYIGPENRE